MQLWKRVSFRTLKIKRVMWELPFEQSLLGSSPISIPVAQSANDWIPSLQTHGSQWGVFNLRFILQRMANNCKQVWWGGQRTPSVLVVWKLVTVATKKSQKLMRRGSCTKSVPSHSPYLVCSFLKYNYKTSGVNDKWLLQSFYHSKKGENFPCYIFKGSDLPCRMVKCSANAAQAELW